MSLSSRGCKEVRRRGARENTIVSASVKQNNLHMDSPGRFVVMVVVVVVVVDVVVCVSPRPRLTAKITRNPAAREIKIFFLWIRMYLEHEGEVLLGFMMEYSNCSMMEVCLVLSLGGCLACVWQLLLSPSA